MSEDPLKPGSHLRHINELDIARYQNLCGQVHVICPAGTVVILHHGLWHCGGRNRTGSPRYMLRMRLDPTVRQFRLWDTSDLDAPEIAEILGRHFGWYERADGRLEVVKRLRLWRMLTGDAGYDVDFWLGRMENRPTRIR